MLPGRLPGRGPPGHVSQLSPLPVGGPVAVLLPAPPGLTHPLVNRTFRTTSMMLLRTRT